MEWKLKVQKKVPQIQPSLYINFWCKKECVSSMLNMFPFSNAIIANISIWNTILCVQRKYQYNYGLEKYYKNSTKIH